MKKTIFIFALLLLLIPKTTFSQNWNAVCVGINDYPWTSKDREYLAESAAHVKQHLIDYQQWNVNNIALLTDGDASESNIQTATTSMPTSAGNINFLV